MIDENTPHLSRGNSEKMQAILKPHRRPAGEPQKRFTDQRRRLQGVADKLAGEQTFGDAAQVVVDRLVRTLQCRVIAARSTRQQTCKVVPTLRCVCQC